MLDTNVFVAGIGWPRWPREVLLAGLRGDLQLVASPYVLDQTRRVLAKRFPERLLSFENFLARGAVEIVPNPGQEELDTNAGLVRDVTDVPVVLAAINAQVDYLVSEDKDLTSQDTTTELFHDRLTVLLPGTFLREVLGWTGDDLERLRGRNWEDIET